jgi:predicted N-acetyltransferase YhbS
MTPPDDAPGPVRATAPEIDRINRVFSEAFTERYQRDGMTGVQVPRLNPAIWKFALAHAAEDALLWRDAAGEVMAFNIVHRSGTEGWMGPLAVRPDRQGTGLGGVIVREGIRRLEAAGARVIGLETMPRTVDNIGFYSRLGFRPGHLTVSVSRDLSGPGEGKGVRASGAKEPDPIGACRALTEALAPGVNFSREIALTLEHGLGDATLVYDDGALAGFALWHVAPLAEGRSSDEARVLKLVARDRDVFGRLVDAVESDVWLERARRVSIRCQTAYRDAYGMLLDAGYGVHWTDLRMTLDGRAEVPARNGGVVFSNWEI